MAKRKMVQLSAETYEQVKKHQSYIRIMLNQKLTFDEVVQKMTCYDDVEGYKIYVGGFNNWLTIKKLDV